MSLKVDSINQSRPMFIGRFQTRMTDDSHNVLRQT